MDCPGFVLFFLVCVGREATFRLLIIVIIKKKHFRRVCRSRIHSLPRLALLFIRQTLASKLTSKSAQTPSTHLHRKDTFGLSYHLCFSKPSCCDADTCPAVEFLVHCVSAVIKMFSDRTVPEQCSRMAASGVLDLVVVCCRRPESHPFQWIISKS